MISSTAFFNRSVLVAALLTGMFLSACDSGIFGPDGLVVINGIVVDADTRAPIASATVTISTGIDTVLVTGPDGRFVISPAPAGTYSVSASAEGYRTASFQITADVSLVGPDTLALSATMPASGLVAYWPLNRSASDVVGGHHGSASGVRWSTDRFGASNSAAQFLGGSDVITVPDAGDLKFGTIVDLSVTAWVLFPSNQPSSPAVISKMDGGSRPTGFELRINGDVAEAVIQAGGGTVGVSNFTGLDGGWRMIGFSVSRAGRRIELYIDGEYANFADGAAIAASFDASSPLLIGRSSLGSATFAGSIDDVRLFGRRLSAEDFRALYRERGYQP